MDINLGLRNIDLTQLCPATSPLWASFLVFWGLHIFYVPWLSKSYEFLLIYESFQEPWQWLKPSSSPWLSVLCTCPCPVKWYTLEHRALTKPNRNEWDKYKMYFKLIFDNLIISLASGQWGLDFWNQVLDVLFCFILFLFLTSDGPLGPLRDQILHLLCHLMFWK